MQQTADPEGPWAEYNRGDPITQRQLAKLLGSTTRNYDWPHEDDDPLFDSTRDYVEQMDRYKQHQGKPITHSATTARRRRKANGGGAP
jgi:hypothetical protein